MRVHLFLLPLVLGLLAAAAASAQPAPDMGRFTPVPLPFLGQAVSQSRDWQAHLHQVIIDVPAGAVGAKAPAVRVTQTSGDKVADEIALDYVRTVLRPFNEAMRRGAPRSMRFQLVIDARALLPLGPTKPLDRPLHTVAGETPPPPYPTDLPRGARLEGTAVLRVSVGGDGKPRKVKVLQSTGSGVLDRAAVAYAQANWRFPQAAGSYAEVPAVFRLR